MFDFALCSNNQTTNAHTGVWRSLGDFLGAPSTSSALAVRMFKTPDTMAETILGVAKKGIFRNVCDSSDWFFLFLRKSV
jgi:hypothetical protein